MSIFKSKIISACEKAYFSPNKAKFICNTALPEGFTVTCHAGSFHTKANSLDSIRTAVDWGADIVEFDVSFRPDGTAVIIHDSSPSMKQGEMLDEALKIVATDKKCRINLDIKSTANLPEVDRLVKKHGLSERVFYTGVFEDWVEAVRKSSSIPYYLNHKITVEEAKDESSALEIINKAKELGAIGINSHYENATKEFSDIAHKNGLLISLWTVNKISDMAKVIETQPDNITTKKPNILKLIAEK